MEGAPPPNPVSGAALPTATPVVAPIAPPNNPTPPALVLNSSLISGGPLTAGAPVSSSVAATGGSAGLATTTGRAAAAGGGGGSGVAGAGVVRATNFMMEGVGARVIRGVDWKWGKQVKSKDPSDYIQGFKKPLSRFVMDYGD